MKNIFSVLLIIVAVAIFFAYIKPTYGTIRTQQAELKSYEDTIKQAEKLDAMIKDLQSKVEALDQEKLAMLEKLLPDTVSNVNLIIDINNIAAQAGLQISNIDLEQVGTNDKMSGEIEKPSDNNLYDSIDLSFDVSATYDDFQTFIAALEKSLRLVDITKISFRPTDEAGEYSFKVTVRTYWLK